MQKENILKTASHAKVQVKPRASVIRDPYYDRPPLRPAEPQKAQKPAQVEVGLTPWQDVALRLGLDFFVNPDTILAERRMVAERAVQQATHVVNDIQGKIHVVYNKLNRAISDYQRTEKDYVQALTYLEDGESSEITDTRYGMILQHIQTNRDSLESELIMLREQEAGAQEVLRLAQQEPALNKVHEITNNLRDGMERLGNTDFVEQVNRNQVFKKQQEQTNRLGKVRVMKQSAPRQKIDPRVAQTLERCKAAAYSNMHPPPPKTDDGDGGELGVSYTEQEEIELL